MKKLICISLILLTISCSMIFEAKPLTAPAENTEVSRTSGVAPLSVHFKAGYEKDLDKLSSFHSLSYSWDFGDGGSGVWGTDGKSKNVESGPIATHVFESPGVYTVELTVRDKDDVISRGSYKIEVADPDTFYAGNNTICVSSSGDFTGAPSGAQTIHTTDLNNVAPLAVPGTRVLFRRGDNWIVNSPLQFPSNGDGETSDKAATTLGAFGSGSSQDELGLYDNAPEITINSGPFIDLNYKQNWRIMDLSLVDSSKEQECFEGVFDMERILFLNLKIEGFNLGIAWSHFNDPTPMPIDQMVLANNKITDSGVNCIYVGGERIALLGNIGENADDSHVARVWQAYRGIISHNEFSGSSIVSGTGRQALKLHGPGNAVIGPETGYMEYGDPVDGTSLLENHTEETIVSDNLFGASGPWPVSIGPQNGQYMEEIFDIIFERNSIVPEYGTSNSMDVTVGLCIWAQNVTIRNNIFDGTGGGEDYTAIMIGEDRNIPLTKYVDVSNNTVYRADNDIFGYSRYGFFIGNDASDVYIKNNIVSFPGVNPNLIDATAIKGLCEGLSDISNIFTEDAGLVDPDNGNPSLRNYSLRSDSIGIDNGSFTSAISDYVEKRRTDGYYDVGAFER